MSLVLYLILLLGVSAFTFLFGCKTPPTHALSGQMVQCLGLLRYVIRCESQLWLSTCTLVDLYSDEKLWFWCFSGPITLDMQVVASVEVLSEGTRAISGPCP